MNYDHWGNHLLTDLVQHICGTSGIAGHTRLFVLFLFVPRHLCIFFPYSFFFFFIGWQQSTVQLFGELFNPPSDLSRAAQPNRIVVLTPMTIPPAVVEPPVGQQEDCVGGGKSL